MRKNNDSDLGCISEGRMPRADVTKVDIYNV